ncbi:MAG: hypothetical protein Q4D62_04495 [Planctomycetia bacterium]|nr:hypothetical protein [Planctomycetia bacterium]
MGTIFVMVILCGWNPYVTNTWNHTSPFYPLHTLDEVNHPKEDILAEWYTWDHFRDATPVQRFFYTHLIARQPMLLHVQTAKDFPIDIEDLKFFSLDVDEYRCGIFSLLLVFSLGLLFFVQRWDHWLVIGGILLTIVIQPHSWWDRFIPQLYALPVLILIILQSQVQKDYPSWTPRWNGMLCFFFTFALLNSSFCFINQLKVCVGNSFLESKEMALWQASPQLRMGFIFEALQTQEEVNVGNESRGCYYGRCCLNNAGFEKITIVPTNQKINREKEDIFYCYGWTYTLPKKQVGTTQSEDDMCLDHSDVNYSELPEALEVVGKVRWRQFCKAWNVE